MSSRYISRREFLKQTALFGPALILAGCQQQAPPTEQPASNTQAPTAIVSRPITLQFPSWQQDEPGSSDWWKKRISEFEAAHSNVTIEFTKVANADIASNFLSRFSAGAPPQIVHLPYLNMFDFASEGFLEPLDDLLSEADVPENWTALQEGCKWEGTTYALLLLAYGYSMIYNEQMYNENGITAPPTSGPEFVEASQKVMRAPDIFGTGICTVPGFNFFIHMQEYIIGAGGNLMTDGRPSANTPEAVEGVSWWLDIINAGATPTGTDTGPMRQMLMEGKMATYLDGPWGQGFVAQANPEVQPHLKVARMPFQNILGGLSNIVAMPMGLPEDEKELVGEFIKSLTTPTAQEEYLTMYCSPQPRTDVQVSEEELLQACPLITPWYEAFNSPDLVDYFPYGLEGKTVQLQNLVSEVGQRMITEGGDIQIHLDDLQRRMEELQAS